MAKNNTYWLQAQTQRRHVGLSYTLPTKKTKRASDTDPSNRGICCES